MPGGRTGQGAEPPIWIKSCIILNNYIVVFYHLSNYKELDGIAIGPVAEPPAQSPTEQGAKPGRMSSLRVIDLGVVDDLVDFIRGRGYVLDFSDASFSQFFAAELD